MTISSFQNNGEDKEGKQNSSGILSAKASSIFHIPNNFLLQDYSVSETTLEQIFLGFARSEETTEIWFAWIFVYFKCAITHFWSQTQIKQIISPVAKTKWKTKNFLNSIFNYICKNLNFEIAENKEDVYDWWCLFLVFWCAWGEYEKWHRNGTRRLSTRRAPNQTLHL